jgi:hypothetical protein
LIVPDLPFIHPKSTEFQKLSFKKSKLGQVSDLLKGNPLHS